MLGETRRLNELIVRIPGTAVHDKPATAHRWPDRLAVSPLPVPVASGGRRCSVGERSQPVHIVHIVVAECQRVAAHVAVAGSVADRAEGLVQLHVHSVGALVRLLRLRHDDPVAAGGRRLAVVDVLDVARPSVAAQ